jgi:hypothetical protein
MNSQNKDLMNARYDTFLKDAEANQQALEKEQPVPIT